MMREKLIDLLKESPLGVEELSLGHIVHRRIVEHIADHLLANGVIVPPCLVEQDIYIAKKNKVEMTFARTFKYLGKEIGLEVEATHYKRDRDGWLELKTDIIHECEFGKTVFLTREEAEKALKERSNENAE